MKVHRQISFTLRLAALAGHLRLPAGAQRLWPGESLIVGAQQDIHLDRERAGQAVEDIHGRVYDPALDTRQVWRGDAGIDSKRLLRQPARRTQVPDIPREARPSIHGRQARDWPHLIHELYNMNYELAGHPVDGSRAAKGASTSAVGRSS